MGLWREFLKSLFYVWCRKKGNGCVVIFVWWFFIRFRYVFFIFIEFFVVWRFTLTIWATFKFFVWGPVFFIRYVFLGFFFVRWFIGFFFNVIIWLICRVCFILAVYWWVVYLSWQWVLDVRFFWPIFHKFPFVREWFWWQLLIMGI